ncbi:MAG: hypothetical protein ACI4QN_05345 [Candidatus Coproplasma sp.]
MSTHKTKIRKLSEAQYNEYVAALRDDAALYSADGELVIPDEIAPPKEEDNIGD